MFHIEFFTRYATVATTTIPPDRIQKRKIFRQNRISVQKVGQSLVLFQQRQLFQHELCPVNTDNTRPQRLQELRFVLRSQILINKTIPCSLSANRCSSGGVTSINNAFTYFRFSNSQLLIKSLRNESTLTRVMQLNSNLIFHCKTRCF